MSVKQWMSTYEFSVAALIFDVSIIIIVYLFLYKQYFESNKVCI